MNMAGPSCKFPCPGCEITGIKPEKTRQGPLFVAAQGVATPVIAPDAQVRRFEHTFAVSADGSLAPQLCLRSKQSIDRDAEILQNARLQRAREREQDPSRPRKLIKHEKGVNGLSILLALTGFCLVTDCVTDIMHLLLNILQRFGDLFFDKKYKVCFLTPFTAAHF